MATLTGGRTQTDRLTRMQAARTAAGIDRQRIQRIRTAATRTAATENTQTNTRPDDQRTAAAEIPRRRPSTLTGQTRTRPAVSTGQTRPRTPTRTDPNSNFAIVPVNLGTVDGVQQDPSRPVLAIVPLENNAEPSDFVNFARTIPRSVLQQAHQPGETPIATNP